MYHFDHIARLSFGFASPPHAAACFALLIVALWNAQFYLLTSPLRRARPALYLLEAALLLATAFTITRAAFFALAGAWVCHFTLWKRPGDWKIWLCSTGVRVAYCYLALLCIGGSGRFAASYAATDPSVTHRFEYWKSAIAAVGSTSIWGAGTEQSATCWMEWFRPLNSDRVAYGFSNAPLEIAFEYGAPGAFILFAGLAYVILRPHIAKVHRLRRTHTILAFSASGSLAILLINCFFALPWSPSLLALELFTLAIGVVALRPQRNERTLGIFICAGAVLFTSGMFAGAREYAKKYNAPIHFAGSRRVVLSSQSSASVGTLAFVCDPRVNSPLSGCFLRDVFSALGGRYSVERQASLQPVRTNAETAVLVACGYAWHKGLPTEGYSEIILLHPLGPPKPDLATRKIRGVILPEVDDNGYCSAWKAWSTEQKIPVVYTSHSGTDVSSNGKTVASLLGTIKAL